jgi:hypothetical protein
MGQQFSKNIVKFLVILSFGVVPSIIAQFFEMQPVSRKIHISNFRYGKNPSVIQCNRGDTLLLTFSSEDTGHSFFLEEFDVDVKVSPARKTVEVFKTSNPTLKSYIAEEVQIIARHPGWLNYLISRSNYRCHVWCGPMHAFEHGKLIIWPNTLLIFIISFAVGILFLWFLGKGKTKSDETDENQKKGYTDLFEKIPFLKKFIVSRWPQLILILFAMVLVYLVILTTFFGTKMSGRNLGVLLMWAVWLFLLIAILTPFLGRTWCTICPLPVFGDFIQRKSLFQPTEGTTKEYRNKYNGLFLKWPKWLQNDWPKLALLLALTTFSTTLVALPKVTGMAVIAMVLLPSILSAIFEHRAFCRYLCPVSGFLGPFSRMGRLSVRSKSQSVCDKCKTHFCSKGSSNGWACPYGINVGEMRENSDCGMCLECTRSCLYHNVTLYTRPFGTESGTRNYSEAWLTIGVFTLAIVYNVLYQGHWYQIRDYINILDKGNWYLFAIYALVVWSVALIAMPAVLFALAFAGNQLSGVKTETKYIFLQSAGALLPLGLMLWIAFVVPMLFVNVTFVLQSFSDPFGWGWDFFGTAGIPWHQFVPRLVPWLQSAFVLSGLYLSLRNLNKNTSFQNGSHINMMLVLPSALFIAANAAAMLFFFTN